MTKDLPNRPKSDKKRTAPIKDTDRVKSAANKLDPRFEAARQKSHKEDTLRAKAAKGGSASNDDEAAPTDTDKSTDSETIDETPKPKKGFSFNMTDQERS